MKDVVRAHHVYVSIAPDHAGKDVLLSVLMDKDGRAQARLASASGAMIGQTAEIGRPDSDE